MILDSLKLRGIGPFRDDVALDFTAIPAGSIVALVGDNGQGKTTLLECMAPAVLHREHPSYRDPKGGKGEPLASHVRPDVRDAYIEASYRLGTRQVLVHVDVDGKRGKTEAYVTADGQIRGPLLKEVDQELAKHFPSRALLLAGPFACQGGFDGFFRLGPTDRKDLFAELLGLGHLQELAARAGGHEKDVLALLERARDRARAAAPAVERQAAIRAELTTARTAMVTAEGQRDAAAAKYDTAALAHATAREALAKIQADVERVASERRRLEVSERDAAAGVDALAGRLTGLDALLSDAQAIEAAATELARLDLALDEARSIERACSGRLPELEAEVARTAAELATLANDYRRMKPEVEAAKAAAARVAAAGDLDAVRIQAEADLLIATDAIAAYDGQLGELEAAADDEGAAIARRTQLETRRDTLAPRRGLLDRIPGVEACGTCPLTADARKAGETLAEVEVELAALPAIAGTPAADRLRECRTARRNAETARDRHQRTLADITAKIAALAGDREPAARAAAAEVELGAVYEKGTAAKQASATAESNRFGARAAAEAARVDVEQLERSRTQVAPQAARLPEIAAARGQRTALATQHAERLEQLGGVRTELAALPVVDVAGAEFAVIAAADGEAEALRERDTQAVVIRHCEREQARLEGELAALGDPQAELDAATADEDRLVTEAADWSLLERALGNRGVQALLIDAAGPEVSAIANDLLAACYTPRFQIALTTTQPTADGKGVKEVFDARILDAEVGRDGTRGSGGETALIDAALRLATVIVNVRRSGMETRTLWLDEATAALSPANAPCYVAMIRRAMAIGGFHACFLISHQQDVWEAADHRIIVEDGTARFAGMARSGGGEAVADVAA